MRTRSRALVAALVLVLGLASPALAQSPPAPSSTPVSTPVSIPGVPARLAGADRFDTAARVAEATYPSGARAAVLVAADAWADAVAGTGLAGAVGGPVLLTAPDRLPDRTRGALERLDVQTVHVVGGTSTVSQAVLDGLPPDVRVQRVSAEDRYGTAAEVARAIAAEVPVGELDGRTTALLATGADFPDALTAGPMAYWLHLPVLLTRAGAVPAATEQVLRELDVERVVVLGGSDVVSPGVVEQLGSTGLQVDRLAGQDRTQTAIAVADALLARTGPAPAVLLARGDAHADSLAAGPRGGVLGAPVLLTSRPDQVGSSTAAWLAGRCPTVITVQAVGGPVAVTGAALQAAQDAAEACDPAQRVIPYTVGTRGPVTADLSRFRDVVADVLEDDRGWDLGGALEFTEVAAGAPLRIWLADPAAVAAASSGCSATYSCRVGADVYINEVRWETATTTWASRPLDDYRHYVVNHEVGHWLGLGHTSCSGSGRPAPVMQQQSIRLDGCTPNVWPLEAERAAVGSRWAL